jgi:predicted RNA-binding Zn-ribbon protein involved in translation (DUF1610 family)
MPAPEEDPDHRKVVTFNCPQCGATTAYSAADEGLTCTHCGYYEPPQKAVVGKGAEEFEFTVTTLERAAHGWGEARKELQCQNCGAYTSIPLDTLTHSCPFCGSNNVIQREAPQEVLRPRFLIPFQIEAQACHDFVREWLGSSWMTPGALRQMARVAEFTGLYLPFWTFDAVNRADWKAQVGHTTTERYYSNGKWRTRTKTVWKWESGQVQLTHDDLLTPGTARLSDILLNRLRNYDLQALAPYEPKYLAGFQAQAYDVPLETAWETARHEMRELTRQACRDQASTNKIRNFSMNLDFADESWRYILLPVYIANYLYEDQTYQVMVNGQTGTVAGQRPVAWLKIWLAVAGLLIPGTAIGIVALILMATSEDAGGIVGVVGFILLVTGLTFSFHLVRAALAMDDI